LQTIGISVQQSVISRRLSWPVKTGTVLTDFIRLQPKPLNQKDFSKEIFFLNLTGREFSALKGPKA
jgi:hypothetical protein